MTKAIVKKKKSTRGKRWFGTSWSTEDRLWAKNIWLGEHQKSIRFFSGQLEECPKTSRKHWQFIIHFYDRMGLRSVRKIIRMGKGKEAGDLQPQYSEGACQYVLKQETSAGERFTYGEKSIQGFRSDLEDIRVRIVTQVQDRGHGESTLAIANDHFGTYLRYNQGMRQYQKLVMEEASQEYRKVEVEIISGPTRSGKTRKYLYDENNKRRRNVFIINAGNGCSWWDGYNGQDTILIDEFKNQIQLTVLLGLLDGHQMRMAVKGSHVYCLATKIIITTNLRKEEIYPGQTKELLEPLWARVTKFTSLYPEEPKWAKVKWAKVTLGNTECLRSPLPTPEEDDYHSKEYYNKLLDELKELQEI